MSRRNYTSEIIDNFLTFVVFSGSLALTIVAPNALVALEKPLLRFLNRQSKTEAKRIARYLKQQKIVNVTPNDDDSFRVTLTEGGKKRAYRAYFEKLNVTDEKWDKKWRVLIFDIPEKHKTTRDYIRFHLRRIGFKPLQKSVFAYPYQVDEFIAVMYELFPNVKPYFSYMTVSEIDQHNALVKQFKHLI